MRDVAIELSPLIAEQDIDFSIDTEPCPVPAHEWMLRELTRNLLHNAIKHSPPGGALRVGLLSDERTAALIVRDSGPGIAPALRERLFQPFATDHRAGPSLSGSGLGLAICREIVQSLGGQIELDNRTDGGSVRGLDATVRLPLIPATA